MVNTNHQPPESVSNGFLEIQEIFYSIQGEGPFAGTPAVFIRLAGCNLQCPHCDTDYTSKREQISIPTIVKEIESLSSKGLIVITGGEPFRQTKIRALINFLNAKLQDHYIQIESNGTILPPILIDGYNKDTSERRGNYLVISPKTTTIHKRALELCCALKYVGSCDDLDEDDGLPIHPLNHPVHRFAFRPGEDFDRPIYLQPTDVDNPFENIRNIDAVKESCLKHGYILQLQIHKLLKMR